METKNEISKKDILKDDNYNEKNIETIDNTINQEAHHMFLQPSAPCKVKVTNKSRKVLAKVLLK